MARRACVGLLVSEGKGSDREIRRENVLRVGRGRQEDEM